MKAESTSTDHGFINVFKPPGLSSHQAVHRIRRITGIRRIGHGGTLDPNAAGVLPVAVGRATRLLEWAALQPKVYQAVQRLGLGTSSGDADGKPVAYSGPPWPAEDELRQNARWLTGRTLQIPPQVSAIKQQGEALYRAVRRGESVWPAPRWVDISDWEIFCLSPERVAMTVTVSSGTYVRALARDLAYLSGHAGHLEQLLRTRTGKFVLWDAVSLDELSDSGSHWTRWLRAPQDFLDIPVVAMESKWRDWIGHGRIGDWPELFGYDGDIALSLANDVVAVVTGPPWRYRKVLLEP